MLFSYNKDIFSPNVALLLKLPRGSKVLILLLIQMHDEVTKWQVDDMKNLFGGTMIRPSR